MDTSKLRLFRGTSLPPLKASSPTPLNDTCKRFLDSPFRPVATKAERYALLMKYDREKLKRPRAHVRNALKTTEGLERIAKQLKTRLESIQDRKDKISLERLAAFRDAFEDVIKENTSHATKLSEIKEAYNDYVLFVLSQHAGGPCVHIPGPPMATLYQSSKNGKVIAGLRKKVHELEVKARVLLRENERLRDELANAALFHAAELERINNEGENMLAMENLKIAKQRSEKDFIGKVEDLQLQIVDKQDAIDQLVRGRKGLVPLSVCHNLEQCLREAEIETQKGQKRNTKLRQDIQKGEEALMLALQQNGLKLDSDLRPVLGFS